MGDIGGSKVAIRVGRGGPRTLSAILLTLPQPTGRGVLASLCSGRRGGGGGVGDEFHRRLYKCMFTMKLDRQVT